MSETQHTNYAGGKLPRCDFCQPENASWLSASVHADCANIGDGEHVNPIEDRVCNCDCQYPNSTPLFVEEDLYYKERNTKYEI